MKVKISKEESIY